MKLLESALAQIAALTEERDALKCRADFAEDRLALADAENANLRAQIALMATASQVRAAGEKIGADASPANSAVTVFGGNAKANDESRHATPTDTTAPAA